jgi:hypothetical protein
MRALEPSADLRIARVTVEFLGVMPRRDLRVEAHVVRPGRRIQLLEAAMYAEGRCVALARAWQIAAQASLSEMLDDMGEEERNVLPPEQLQDYFVGMRRWGYGQSIEWRWEQGAFDRPGPASVWARVRLPLVAGEALHPLDRALILADSANGISAVLPQDRWLLCSLRLGVTGIRPEIGSPTALLSCRDQTAKIDLGGNPTSVGSRTFENVLMLAFGLGAIILAYYGGITTAVGAGPALGLAALGKALRSIVTAASGTGRGAATPE